MTDLILEILRALITGAIFIYLWGIGRKGDFRSEKGWSFIIGGFALVLLGMTIVITDNFPSLNRFLIIGDTRGQALVEKVFGFLFGFMLLAVGFWKWMPIVAQRKKLEAAQRTSEEKYRLVVENANDAIFVVQDENIVFANQRASRLFGYEAGELLEKSFASLIPAEDGHRLFDGEEGSPGGDNEGREHTFRMIGHKGGTLWVSMNSVPVPWEEKDATLCMIRDVTRQKELENQVLHSRKMEAIGTLAGGIAHDFNNILFAILGNAQLLGMKLEAKGVVTDELKQIVHASNRAADLVKQILVFSRRNEPDLHPLQLAPVVKETVKLLRSSLPASIEIRQNISCPAKVLSDPTQIHQVVMNLCTNAFHAMEGGEGVLRIDVLVVSIGVDDKGAPHGLKPGRYARLSVTDTGHGIDPAILERIFEPYFTTKEMGKGTGLGLSVVHGIVTNLGGAIKVSSEPGQGSVFQVYLPVADEVDDRHTKETGNLPTGDERILLVDDEESVARICSHMLGELGYRVEARTNSVEVLQLFKEHSGEFDLVITDVTMPKMGGEKLARELLRIRPEIPVILCTGSIERVDEEQARKSGISAFLVKPVDMSELAATVRKVLDGHSAGQ